MYEYPLWLLIFVILPLLCIWIWNFKVLMKYARLHCFVIIGSILVSFPWDYIMIKERVWYFKEPHIIGIWLLNLPIEEWLFISLVALLFSTVTILLLEKYGVER